jgi:transcription elongation factor Elf1
MGTVLTPADDRVTTSSVLSAPLEHLVSCPHCNARALVVCEPLADWCARLERQRCDHCGKALG